MGGVGGGGDGAGSYIRREGVYMFGDAGYGAKHMAVDIRHTSRDLFWRRVCREMTRDRVVTRFKPDADA